MLPAFLIAGAISAVLTPIDTLKTRIQSQTIKNYSIVRGVREIQVKEGSIGLFSGVEWRVLRNGLQSGIYMYVYELMVRHLMSNTTTDGH